MYHNNILPTTMLAYLVTYNSSLSAAYIEVIVDIKCQILILCLGESLIQYGT